MMKFGKGISCTIKSPPFLACLYISHQVKRAFVGELSRLVLTTQLLLVDCFSSCKFQVVATVALIVHHSVAIIPMPYTDWTALLLLFKVSNDNVRPQQHRTAPETVVWSLEASEMSAVITQSCKVHQKKSWLTGCNGS